MNRFCSYSRLGGICFFYLKGEKKLIETCCSFENFIRLTMQKAILMCQNGSSVEESKKKNLWFPILSDSVSQIPISAVLVRTILSSGRSPLGLGN